jgi:flagellar protein FlaG
MSQELHPIGAGLPGPLVVVPSGGHAGGVEPDAATPEQAAAAQGSLSHNREAVEAAVEEANQALANTSLSVRFSVEGDTNRIVVRLTDQGTGKVVRQIPSEDQLAIEARLRELVGVFFSSQA